MTSAIQMGDIPIIDNYNNAQPVGDFLLFFRYESGNQINAMGTGLPGVISLPPHHQWEISTVKENLYVTAIKNLYKKFEFVQLSLQFAEGSITEDELESELETNQDKYVIRMKKLDNPSDLKIISDIIKKTERSFSVDEVSEVFSIDINSLNKGLQIFENNE